MIPDSNILNNKRSISSFSVQKLSIFTFSRRNKASFSHNPHHNDMIISHFVLCIPSLECQRFSNAEQRELQRLEERNALPAYDC